MNPTIIRRCLRRWLRVPARILVLAAAAMALAVAAETPTQVNISTFVRAETDVYMGRAVKDGAFATLRHRRAPTPIDQQDVVRMNRDTLYSNGVFDLDAAPITITLPDPGTRFMSMQVLSQDHETAEVVYAPGRFTYDRRRVGTRYTYLIIRTLADPQRTDDVQAANALQDAIRVEQASPGSFVVPAWDQASHTKAREALLALGALGGTGVMFGRKGEVDPVSFLIGTAAGWGGNPPSAAVYNGVFPKRADGKTVHRLTVRDVPVDGFWSVSVYNAKGFFEPNDVGSYSLNNLTAKPDADGSITIQFGGDPKAAPNHLPITPGWNYTVRLYRPRSAVIDGSWKFPEAQPVP